MNKTLDNFGFGLSIVFILLYWHAFDEVDLLGLNDLLGIAYLEINTIKSYTIGLFLTQLFIFGNLVFSEPPRTACYVLRTIGWLLILLGYLVFLMLNGGMDLETLLRQPGGGINRFD